MIAWSPQPRRPRTSRVVASAGLVAFGVAVMAVLSMPAATLGAATGVQLASLAGAVPVAGTVVPGAGAGIAPPVRCPLGLVESAQLDPVGGAPSTVCSGYVTSFDGTPLSTDVTIPDGAAGPLPLVVFLHGWGSNKSNFESVQLGGNGSPYTYHWNNAWFASQGFAVLNFTARGFWHSCGKVPLAGAPSAGGITAFDPVYLTQPGCSGRASWTHLADRRWEVRDVQTLVGKLVDARVAQPDQVVVTGDSYGGGQSWLLALSQDRVMRRNGTTVPWRSPDGTPVHLAAAIPLFGWTDLAQALVDNGGAAIAQVPAAGSPPATSHITPYGIAKLSYVSGLFGLGEASAQYAPPAVDPSADLTSWFAALAAGEPYSANPVATEAVRQLAEYRSAWYMPVPSLAKAVPIFTVQGVTDPLFPAMQSVQMEQRLRAARPGYPIWTVLADVGHSYANNPPAVWQRILDQANAWLLTVLHHRSPGQPKVEAATVACLPGQQTTWVASNHLRSLADRVLVLSSSSTSETTSVGTDPVEDVQTDPIAQSGCRTLPSTEATGPGLASFTMLPAMATPVTLLGAPVVHADALLAGTNAELAASLWEVNPATGQQTLITRSVQRLQGEPGQTLRLAFELWPTAWPVAAGDELQLQLTQNDAPTWRPDNEPSALQLSHVQLRVPVSSQP
ncbi:MAG: hypothetical protein M0013_10360 [Actinomycetota bacterium]|nr:hypothetical protein [Actinomycetota bacterium]